MQKLLAKQSLGLDPNRYGTDKKKPRWLHVMSFGMLYTPHVCVCVCVFTLDYCMCLITHDMNLSILMLHVYIFILYIFS